MRVCGVTRGQQGLTLAYSKLLDEKVDIVWLKVYRAGFL
jgi:hypothetical protein